MIEDENEYAQNLVRTPTSLTRNKRFFKENINITTKHSDILVLPTAAQNTERRLSNKKKPKITWKECVDGFQRKWKESNIGR